MKFVLDFKPEVILLLEFFRNFNGISVILNFEKGSDGFTASVAIDPSVTPDQFISYLQEKGDDGLIDINDAAQGLIQCIHSHDDMSKEFKELANKFLELAHSKDTDKVFVPNEFKS